MRILLTNDDGYEAPGLLALHRAARALPGADLRVISTTEPYSGKGHVVSPHFHARDTELPSIGRITVIDGTPADCVRAALALPDEPRPDYVLSGINYGSNLGIDVYYSGTAAAAREAAILGISSIAISKLVKEGFSTDWDSLALTAATVAAGLIHPDEAAPAELDADLHAQIARIARDPAAAGAGFWNVNLPCLPNGQRPECVQLAALSTDGYHILYVPSHDEHGRLRLTNRGNYHQRPASKGTDVDAAFSGHISITRVPL